MSDKTSSNGWNLMTLAWIATIIMGIGKLIGLFPYSWWVVCAPVIIGLGLSLGILLFVLVIGLLSLIGVWLFTNKIDKKRKNNKLN